MKEFKTKMITIYEREWTYGGAEEGGWYDWNTTLYRTIKKIRNSKQLRKAIALVEKECMRYNTEMQGTDRNGYDNYIFYKVESKKTRFSQLGMKIWE